MTFTVPASENHPLKPGDVSLILKLLKAMQVLEAFPLFTEFAKPTETFVLLVRTGANAFPLCDLDIIHFLTFIPGKHLRERPEAKQAFEIYLHAHIFGLTYGSLQKPLQPGTLIPFVSSLRRSPATQRRPQQSPVYQPISTLPRGVSTADTGAWLNASQDSSLVLVPRSGSSRAPSVCSSVVLDTKELLPKSELSLKPPVSAPPSILVKPDTSRNTMEKQVKTVRFQNYSPPPSKRQSSLSSPNLSNGRPEQGSIIEAVQPEANKSPEISVLYSHRIVSSPVHQRRVAHPKTSSLDLTGQSGYLTFPTRREL
ncbi:E3 ubiquitin-protein ligase SH3RF2 [Varanus komodoensis]|nr:E3 ubiquitin-protein ligase SH3RF2 [Varanus komodoensis]